MRNNSSHLWKLLDILGIVCLLAVMTGGVLGCATIVSKSDWPVYVKSTPDQAEVTITDVKTGKKIFVGKTPTTCTLSSSGGYFSGKEYSVDISKEGFESKKLQITSPLNGWYVGNVVFGGLIGLLIVDPATGAMWTLSPKEVDVSLTKKLAQAANTPGGNPVVNIKDVPSDVRDKMIQVK